MLVRVEKKRKRANPILSGVLTKKYIWAHTRDMAEAHRHMTVRDNKSKSHAPHRYLPH